MELKRRLIELKDYDGNKHNLRKLNVQTTEMLMAEFDKVKGDAVGTIKLQRKVLEDCGMPESLISDLDIEDFNHLVSEVMGVEKKSANDSSPEPS